MTQIRANKLNLGLPESNGQPMTQLTRRPNHAIYCLQSLQYSKAPKCLTIKPICKLPQPNLYNGIQLLPGQPPTLDIFSQGPNYLAVKYQPFYFATFKTIFFFLIPLNYSLLLLRLSVPGVTLINTNTFGLQHLSFLPKNTLRITSNTLDTQQIQLVKSLKKE